ncbi:uncharacterized protein METZ01_LOCUS492038, partial [marine metagenome]
QLQFMNALSSQSERVEIQDFFLGLSADRTTSRIEVLSSFHGVPIRVRGTLGDMGLRAAGNPEPVSVQYTAGDIEGELSGEVAEILDGGQIDLRYTARGDRFNTVGQLLDLNLDLDLGATPFLFDAKLRGSWQGISLTHAVGTIGGQGIQIDLVGEARDLFRRNDLEFDLRARSDTLNDLMTALGQSPLIDGTANMTAHLFGRLGGDLGLKDVGIELRTTVGLANAEGVVRGLGTTAR